MFRIIHKHRVIYVNEGNTLRWISSLTGLIHSNSSSTNECSNSSSTNVLDEFSANSSPLKAVTQSCLMRIIHSYAFSPTNISLCIVSETDLIALTFLIKTWKVTPHMLFLKITKLLRHTSSFFRCTPTVFCLLLTQWMMMIIMMGYEKVQV